MENSTLRENKMPQAINAIMVEASDVEALLQTLKDRVRYGDGTTVHQRLTEAGVKITRYMVNRVLNGLNYRKDVWEVFAEIERERQAIKAAELQDIIQKMQTA